MKLEHKHSFKIAHDIQALYRRRLPSVAEDSIWMACEVDGCIKHGLLSRKRLIQESGQV